MENNIEEKTVKSMINTFDDVRLTETQEELTQIEELAKEYRMKGMSDEEANKKAKDEVKKENENAENQWRTFVNNISLHNIVDDLIRRCLIKYKEEYKKKLNKNIDFKLDIREKRSHKTKSAIFGVYIIFECKIEGEDWITIVKKGIEFNHVKEIRKDVYWKFVLYEEVLNNIMFSGISYFLMQYEYNKRKSTEKPL